MRVVLFGTSGFAVPTLQALHGDSRFEVPLVVTQADSRSGRGRAASTSDVQKAAVELGLELHQPEDINTPESVAALQAANADLFLTASYGQKLSDEVLGLASKYALNLHGSLLPRHRGAAPAQHAILQGDTETGVTLVEMTSVIDAGPIFASKKVAIEPTDTAGSLLDRLAVTASELLLEQGDGLAAGSLQGEPQDEAQATKAPAFLKENGKLRWDKTAKEIDQHVRGMTPWPGAYTFCPTDRSPARLLVVKGEVLDLPSPAMPGTVVAFTAGIEVATQLGVYRIDQVKRSGKRALSAVEFLRGFPLPVGTRML
jgi:methionyl-tRNA formyltransferase